ncbi:MAG: class I SAM-dependent methyltransferase [Candidatus Heimdallarchaeota archaeon]|nr:class I SAM-dependent methyltransferase [Candidatus Heimdallarchaeota archaeon]
MSEELRLGINRDKFRQNFNKYTRKAFQTLPKITKPKILDIGCGTGVSTLELARICECEITAIDIDQDSLDIFKKKIEKLGLMHQVQVINCSIHEMTFSHNSFDIIWMEGLQFINFNTRLNISNPLLKKNGFLVIHEGQENSERKIRRIEDLGFILFSRFDLPDNAWWEEYYQPLEKMILEKTNNFTDNSKEMKTIGKIIREIINVKNFPEAMKSIFIILQKMN